MIKMIWTKNEEKIIEEDSKMDASNKEPFTLKELSDNGILEKANELIKSKSDIWIKRSNGNWQVGKVTEFGSAGLLIKVEWQDGKKEKS